MSQPIWQKNSAANIDKTIMEYMAGEDVLLDNHLFLFDIQASIAHVRGLESIDILNQVEANQLCDTLNQLSEEHKLGNFQLDSRFEDCHSAIEFFLTEKLGDLGKKVHTGRSRNDQVAVATRLYLKSSLKIAVEHVKNSFKACIEQAEATAHIPMPGYTHLQRAVPSSCGMWFAGFAEAMLDNLYSLINTLDLIDSNPLGTAAGYGVNLNLDRKLTTELLGFSRLQANPIYAQNSRGKFEIATLNALSQCLLDIRRYCWDLSLFTTQEFDFVSLPDEMTTGSSIMPNKRNPDLIELMRASISVVQGAIVEIQSVLSLPSGYQRDLQLTKGAMIRGITKSLDTLALFAQVIENTQFKQEKLLDAFEPPMYATDLAVELAAEGVPFREAYRQVNDRVEELKNKSPTDSIKARNSPGGCNNLLLNELKERYLNFNQSVKQKSEA